MAREANGLAANPFESVLRTIALDVAGNDLPPQVSLGSAAGRHVRTSSTFVDGSL